MSSKRERLASFGIATKGIVYFIIGLLTAMTAFGYGGKKSNSTTVLEFLSSQSYGKFILIVLAIGLLGYVFWRWYQAIANPNNLDNDSKGIIKRVAYFVSGILYGSLAYTAIKIVMGDNSQGGNSFFSKLFNSEYATASAIIIGLILVGKGVYEFYQGYSGKFKDEVESAGLDHRAQKFIMKAGKVGYTSRGIVAGVLGFLFVKAGLGDNAQKLSKTDAFSFIQDEFGSIVMGIVALGLVGYGVFMIIKAKYSSLVVSQSS
ncbi:DUF1206 domain-containing protein [Dokdonia sp. Hel_I_53]|uniref:DUF1206 domain-containing protein n=1 Tax=Dokdonia sp. Hel_I_53 TaxID=1566287 RepID=UPI0011990020|nr:DUF1206 domain-containing protein [Dokdonia sp. Hel_I_53]TVZ52483.1 uncharacterized protein DUF1206 [Dokdonia sp. Hel_I_53]